MGLRPSVLATSNLLTMFTVVLLNAILITLVLCAGGILPLTDPTLVLGLFINYGLSITMFTFLLAALLKKATSGSVASLLLFILTFLPFLILISLSEDVHLALRVLCNLLMNTSFSFCLLYMTRLEQQGIGLDWTNLATSPLEGDQLNFLYCWLLLLLDSAVYGLLAVVVSKVRVGWGPCRCLGGRAGQGLAGGRATGWPGRARASPSPA